MRASGGGMEIAADIGITDNQSADNQLADNRRFSVVMILRYQESIALKQRHIRFVPVLKYPIVTRVLNDLIIIRVLHAGRTKE